MTAGVDRQDGPLYTLQEIFQQPLLWPITVARVRSASEQMNLAPRLSGVRVLLTGAGSSAYAAAAAALAWPGAIAVPTTDLLIDAERYLLDVGAVISLARSGESPESAAVAERVRVLCPEILQLAVTCNNKSRLAQSGLDGLIVLDPRTNDRSLVMTGAFSNLVLAGLCLAQPHAAAESGDRASGRAQTLLPIIDKECRAYRHRNSRPYRCLVFVTAVGMGPGGRTQDNGNDSRQVSCRQLKPISVFATVPCLF